MNPVPAHLVAGAAAFLAAVLISAGWVIHLRAGPPLGWIGGAMVAVVPLALVILTAIWLVARAAAGRWIVWRAPTVAAASGALALAFIVLYCGPVACFTMGVDRAMGWFILAGAIAAALAHHAVLERMGRQPH